MVVVRYEPGDVVPAEGCYCLVGHYGESTGVVAWRRKGEPFPAASDSDDVIAPVSFVVLLAFPWVEKRLSRPESL